MMRYSSIRPRVLGYLGFFAGDQAVAELIELLAYQVFAGCCVFEEWDVELTVFWCAPSVVRVAGIQHIAELVLVRVGQAVLQIGDG
jgi:hypothetical protein